MFVPLKTALRTGRVLRVFALGQLCSPKFVEMVSLVGGFDGVWLDQEHTGVTIAEVEECTRAGRAAGIDTFVRLPVTHYASVMRVLEAGASGFMASMVRRLDEVENLVRWARFYPEGERGINGSGVDGHFGMLPMADYFRQANEKTLVGAQVEHDDAVQVIEKIAAVPGLDFLFIGPADLSQTLGIPGQWDHPKLWAAIERVAGASAKSNVPWGILPFSPAFARRCVDLGCRMLSIGMDVWALQRGIRAFQDQYEEFFAS
jgi:4-hydroxy-2-oxoheptanedioate aldolase